MQDPTAVDDQLMNWNLEGLDAEPVPNAADADAFSNFLLEDSALNFWTSFDSAPPQDWSAMNGIGTGGM